MDFAAHSAAQTGWLDSRKGLDPACVPMPAALHKDRCTAQSSHWAGNHHGAAQERVCIQRDADKEHGVVVAVRRHGGRKDSLRRTPRWQTRRKACASTQRVGVDSMYVWLVGGWVAVNPPLAPKAHGERRFAVVERDGPPSCVAVTVGGGSVTPSPTARCRRLGRSSYRRC